MRVSTGSATTKKKLTIRRRSRKAKKPNVKDSKSRPRRKNRKSANVEENQNSAEVSDQMGFRKQNNRKAFMKAKRVAENGESSIDNRLPLSDKETSNRRVEGGRKKLTRISGTGKLRKRMKENLYISNDSMTSASIELGKTNSTMDNECILIEQSQEVIVIDDDDDDEDDKTVENSQASTVNDSIVTISPNKTDQLSPKSTCFVNTTQPTENVSLFYEDITPSNADISVPLYNPINSITNLNLTEKDIIDLDDSSTPVKIKKKKRKTLDDSVVFVGEEIDLEKFRPIQMPVFIPLSSNSKGGSPTKRRGNDSVLNKVIQPFKKFKDHLGSLYSNTSTPKVKKDDLFTISEQKRIEMYNTNTYNPNKDEKKKPGKRMVIVDGSNIAFGHSLNREFSVKGLEICLDYFEKMGHEVKAVVPQYRLQKTKSTDPEKLEALHRNGKIVFTPCKNLPGKSTSCYDDRFVLQLATEFDAAVVSNDNYRDLLHENPAFKKVIENRVIGYTWCNDMFILPKDPYGRGGPSLSVILNRV